MANQRVQKSSAWTPQPQATSSRLASRPVPAPAKASTPQDIENQAFMEYKHEALGLQLQAKYGTITPQGQERLTLLQAKMDAFRQNRLKSTPSTSLLDIPHLFAPRETSQPLQPKLKIGQVGDKYEREADRVAEQVVKQIHAPVSQQVGQNLQREDMSVEEKELQKKPMLQLRSAKEGTTAAPDLEASIKQARGGGQPLADSIRKPMEQAIGADFSRVKVHIDSRADQLNQSIQAKAFTTGQDVFFRQGAYNPGSRGGQELLAHELTHVVQQNGGQIILQRTGNDKNPKKRSADEDENPKNTKKFAVEIVNNLTILGRPAWSKSARDKKVNSGEDRRHVLGYAGFIVKYLEKGINDILQSEGMKKKKTDAEKQEATKIKLLSLAKAKGYKNTGKAEEKKSLTDITKSLTTWLNSTANNLNVGDAVENQAIETLREQMVNGLEKLWDKVREKQALQEEIKFEEAKEILLKAVEPSKGETDRIEFANEQRETLKEIIDQTKEGEQGWLELVEWFESFKTSFAIDLSKKEGARNQTKFALQLAAKCRCLSGESLLKELFQLRDIPDQPQ